MEKNNTVHNGNLPIDVSVVQVDASTSMDSIPGVSCCYRMRSELCSKMFSLDEMNGFELDVEATFAPHPLRRTLIARLVNFGLVIGVGLTYSIVTFPKENRFIFIGYLTNYTLALTAAYFLFITICTIYRKSLIQPEKGSRAGILVRWTWALYAIVGPLNVLVVLLYWVLEYDPAEPLSFKKVFNHGITCALVLIDGNVIGLIPLRLKQIFIVEVAGVLWLLWSVAHGFSGIGNGDWEGEDPYDDINDDVLYDVLNWKEKTISASTLGVIIIFVVFPVLYLFCWILSLWAPCCRFDGSRRRLYQH